MVATANANPTPVRIALRAATERVARNPFAILLTATVSGSNRSAAPVSGSRMPSALAHAGRASAATAAAIIRPIRSADVAIARRRSNSRMSTIASWSSSAANRATTPPRLRSLATERNSDNLAFSSSRSTAFLDISAALSVRAQLRKTATNGACMSASPTSSSLPTRSVSHFKSSTTRTSARLPAVKPTGRWSALMKLRSTALIALDTSSPDPKPSSRSASAVHTCAA